MANPRVIAECTTCGLQAEHYTRGDGKRISPCSECVRKRALARARAKRDDPAWVKRRREAYARYNASAKGTSRFKRARQGQGTTPEQDALSDDDGSPPQDLVMDGFN